MFIKFLKEEGMMPKKQTVGSSGFDVFARKDCVVKAGEVSLIGLGFALEVRRGTEVQIRSRSGLAAKGIVVAGGIGTVDSDYRGEIIVPLMNLTKKDFKINKGDRIAQLVPIEILQPEIYIYEELSQTTRDTGGFGSTGLD